LPSCSVDLETKSEAANWATELPEASIGNTYGCL